MNYHNLDSLINHIDSRFKIDIEQEWPHDEVHGWWDGYKCTVSRYTKRSSMSSRPLYTIFSIRLENQLVASWGCEGEEDEYKVTLWFGRQREDVVNRQHSRRNELEKLFKHG